MTRPELRLQVVLFVAMPGLCCLLRVTHGIRDRTGWWTGLWYLCLPSGRVPYHSVAECHPHPVLSRFLHPSLPLVCPVLPSALDHQAVPYCGRPLAQTGGRGS